MNTNFLELINKRFPNHMILGNIVSSYYLKLKRLGDTEENRKIVEKEILEKFSKV
jgi:hypothetical protein